MFSHPNLTGHACARITHFFASRALSCELKAARLAHGSIPCSVLRFRSLRQPQPTYESVTPGWLELLKPKKQTVSTLLQTCYSPTAGGGRSCGTTGLCQNQEQSTKAKESPSAKG